MCVLALKQLAASSLNGRVLRAFASIQMAHGAQYCLLAKTSPSPSIQGSLSMPWDIGAQLHSSSVQASAPMACVYKWVARHAESGKCDGTSAISLSRTTMHSCEVLDGGQGCSTLRGGGCA